MWERHPAANKKKLKNSNLSITKPKPGAKASFLYRNQTYISAKSEKHGFCQVTRCARNLTYDLKKRGGDVGQVFPRSE
jgi:hypothetical protein